VGPEDEALADHMGYTLSTTPLPMALEADGPERVRFMSTEPRRKLALEYLLPAALAGRVYDCLAHWGVSLGLDVLWVGAVVASGMITWGWVVGDTAWAVAGAASVLMHLPGLRRMAFADLKTLWELTRRFEPCFLTANMVAGPVCAAWGLFNTRPVAVVVSNMMLSAFVCFVVDCLRIPAGDKLRAVGAYATLFAAVCVASFLSPPPAANRDAIFIRDMTLEEVWEGRVLNMALFLSKYAINVYRRPQRCVVLTDPLPKHQKGHMLVQTLRHIAEESEGASEEGGDEDYSSGDKSGEGTCMS
jgi:hypothetical protein